MIFLFNLFLGNKIRLHSLFLIVSALRNHLSSFRGFMTNERGHREKLCMEVVLPQSNLILFVLLKSLLQAVDDHLKVLPQGIQ